MPNIEMNPSQVYVCSPSWSLLPSPSLLPPPSSLWVIPVHQPQASSIVHRTWTGNSFHTWYYTCFNAILPNLPTLSLSNRVHKTVLYISEKTFIFLYHLTPVRMPIIKKSINNKFCWRVYGGKRILHCWWECKLVQPLWWTAYRGSLRN